MGKDCSTHKGFIEICTQSSRKVCLVEGILELWQNMDLFSSISEKALKRKHILTSWRELSFQRLCRISLERIETFSWTNQLRLFSHCRLELRNIVCDIMHRVMDLFEPFFTLWNANFKHIQLTRPLQAAIESTIYIPRRMRNEQTTDQAVNILIYSPKTVQRVKKSIVVQQANKRKKWK